MCFEAKNGWDGSSKSRTVSLVDENENATNRNMHSQRAQRIHLRIPSPTIAFRPQIFNKYFVYLII